MDLHGSPQAVARGNGCLAERAVLYITDPIQPARLDQFMPVLHDLSGQKTSARYAPDGE